MFGGKKELNWINTKSYLSIRLFSSKPESSVRSQEVNQWVQPLYFLLFETIMNVVKKFVLSRRSVETMMKQCAKDKLDKPTIAKVSCDFGLKEYEFTIQWDAATQKTNVML